MKYFPGDKPVKLLLKAVSSFAVFLIIIILAAAMRWPEIGPDGGYYLSLARDFYQNKADLYNMVRGYNPLGMLILGIPYRFSDHNPYIYSMLILMLVHLFNVIIFYNILRKLEIYQSYIYLFSSLFLLYSLFLDGTYIMLEPVQVMFLLLSTILLLNNKFFFSGIFFSLAFYSKQYSLAFTAGILAYIILSRSGLKEKIMNSLFLTGGFVIPLVFFYFTLAGNIKFTEYLSGLTGLSVLKTTNIRQITGAGYNSSEFLRTLAWVIIIAPLMFFWILYIKYIKINRITGFLAGNIAGFSTVFLFAAYFHYFILILPWCLLLTAILISENGLRFKISFNIIIFSLVLFTGSLLTYKIIKNRIIVYNRDIENKNEIISVIPAGSKVFIYGASPAQYIYSSLQSANSEKLGYIFPHLREQDFYFDRMDKGSFVLLNSSDYKKWEKYSDLRFIARTDHFMIYKK